MIEVVSNESKFGIFDWNLFLGEQKLYYYSHIVNYTTQSNTVRHDVRHNGLSPTHVTSLDQSFLLFVIYICHGGISAVF